MNEKLSGTHKEFNSRGTCLIFFLRYLRSIVHSFVFYFCIPFEDIKRGSEAWVCYVSATRGYGLLNR